MYMCGIQCKSNVSSFFLIQTGSGANRDDDDDDDDDYEIGVGGGAVRKREPSPDDQPCDLRLLTPATCLREFKPPVVSSATTPITPLTSSATTAATPFSMVFQAENLRNSPNLTPVTTGGAYSCERCGNSYARPHSLNRHKRFECGVEPKFECPVCHKKSKHKHNLVLHMRTHQQR